MKKQFSASSGSFTKPAAALTPTELIRLENFKILSQVATDGASTLSQLLGPSEKVIIKRTNGLEPIEGPFAFVIEDELKLPTNWLSSSKKSDQDLPAESLKILGMTPEQVEEHVYGAHQAAPIPQSAQPKAKQTQAKASAAPSRPVMVDQEPKAQVSAVVRVSRKPGKKPLLANTPLSALDSKQNQPPIKQSKPAVAVSDEAIQIQSFKEAPVAQSKTDQQTTSFNHISNFSMLCDGRSHKKRVADLSGCTPGNVTQILASESVRPDRMSEIERRLCLPSGTLAQKRFNSLNELPQLSIDIFQGKTTTEEGYARLSKQENKTVVKVSDKPVQASTTTEGRASSKKSATSNANQAKTQTTAAASEPAPPASDVAINPPAANSVASASRQRVIANTGMRAQNIADAMAFAQTASHEEVTRLLTLQFSDLKPMVSLAVSAVVSRALTGNMTEAQALQVYSLFVDKASVSA